MQLGTRHQLLGSRQPQAVSTGARWGPTCGGAASHIRVPAAANHHQPEGVAQSRQREVPPAEQDEHQHIVAHTIQHEPRTRMPRRTAILCGMLATMWVSSQAQAEGEAAPEEASAPASTPAAAAPEASPAPAPAPPSAEPAPPPPPPLQFEYVFTSDVPPNLRTAGYYKIITAVRPQCWQRIARLIANSQWSELANDTHEGPLADLRQAALYIPWALLQRDDYQAAQETRKTYDDFDSHVLDLEAAAIAAESGDSGPERVQQAFILMSASLDSFLASIPNSYLPNGSKQ